MPKQKNRTDRTSESVAHAGRSDESSDHRRRVFVLGAGVDVGAGFPTMTTLLRDLSDFAEREGLPIHRALRSKLPRIRFKFSDFAGSKSEEMLSRMFSGDGSVLIGQLRSAAAKLGSDAETIGLQPLIERLCDLAERNQLTEEEATEIVRVSRSSREVGGGEPVLEPRLTPVASRGYRHVFLQALRSDADLSDEEREALTFFIAAVSNIEDLLSDYFMRYSLGRRADQKTYLYIVWMFWAFMRIKSAKAVRRDDSIYARLAADLAGDIVTFNYTTLFDPRTLRRVRFFHGRLDEYLQLDTRIVVRDDPLLAAATSIDGIVNFIDSLRLDVESPTEIDVPGIVPPTAFKPVTHRQQLLAWASVDNLLVNAGEVVVVGYSFALADEHFNDLLRRANPRSRVIVINPDIDTASREACRVLGIDRELLNAGTVSGHQTRSHGRLICVEARGEDVTNELLAMVNR